MKELKDIRFAIRYKLAKANESFTKNVGIRDDEEMNLDRGRMSAFVECINLIDEFLNSESTGSISASKDESGILHDVGECNASRGQTDELNKEDVEGALEKRIDCEKFKCYSENSRGLGRCESECFDCALDNNSFKL